MQTVTVSLAERSYPIHIGAGLLGQSELLLPHVKPPLAAVVTNPTVAGRYLAPLRRALGAAGVDALPILIPDGESFKDWQTLNQIFDQLLTHRCERGTTLIALGGGVVGDVGGFAAACYQRGMPFVQVPTTLLAQVDSSVGGKTAINHPLGKNMIGAFYQPRMVLADTDTLATLPDREFGAGIAEVIKYGLVRDEPFIRWLEENLDGLRARDPAALAFAIARSCQNKAEVVAADEREAGERALLNLGHTFGHAIEAATGYGTWLHGEAVAVGMVLAMRLSTRLGLLAKAAQERGEALIQRAGLPMAPPQIAPDRLIDLMRLDKKVSAGRIRFILMRAIGQAFVSDGVADGEVRALLAAGHG